MLTKFPSIHRFTHQAIGDRQLQSLLQVKERHVFGVERFSSTPRSSRALKDASPGVALRMSMANPKNIFRALSMSPRLSRSHSAAAAM